MIFNANRLEALAKAIAGVAGPLADKTVTPSIEDELLAVAQELVSFSFTSDVPLHKTQQRARIALDRYEARRKAELDRLVVAEVEKRMAARKHSHAIHSAQPPTGWKLVPDSATHHMLKAAADARKKGRSSSGEIYLAMLAAAPTFDIAQEP